MKVYIVTVSYETGAYDDRQDHDDTLHVFSEEQKAIDAVANYEKNPIALGVFDDGEEVEGTYYYFGMEVE